MAAIPDRLKQAGVPAVLADRGSRHRRLPLPALELPEVEGHPQTARDDL